MCEPGRVPAAPPPPAPDAVRIITWNLFHCRDGHPGARASRASTWRRRPVAHDGHVHLNRKHHGPMADLLRVSGADLCLLQEVPPLLLPALARRAGMAVAWRTDTAPLVGPMWLRGRLGTLNPDLFRTHEGNANAILAGGRLRPVRGSGRAVRLNPWPVVLRHWRSGELDRGGALLWMSEARRALAARVLTPAGTPVTVVSVHLHNARFPTESLAEARALSRALERVDGALVVGGDMNVPRGHPALEPLLALGLQDPSRDPRMGIDRILVRGLRVTRPARRWLPEERTVTVRGTGGTLRVRLSDHDPVDLEVTDSG